MKFISKYWATLLHPQNRPELTGNILLLGLLLSYIILSVPDSAFSNPQSQDSPIFQESLTYLNVAR